MTSLPPTTPNANQHQDAAPSCYEGMVTPSDQVASILKILHDAQPVPLDQSRYRIIAISGLTVDIPLPQKCLTQNWREASKALSAFDGEIKIEGRLPSSGSFNLDWIEQKHFPYGGRDVTLVVQKDTVRSLEVLSDFKDQSGRRLRELIRDESNGCDKTELTFDQLLDSIRKLPDYDKRTREVEITVEGITTNLKRPLSNAATILERLLGAQLSKLPNVLLALNIESTNSSCFGLAFRDSESWFTGYRQVLKFTKGELVQRTIFSELYTSEDGAPRKLGHLIEQGRKKWTTELSVPELISEFESLDRKGERHAILYIDASVYDVHTTPRSMPEQLIGDALTRVDSFAVAKPVNAEVSFSAFNYQVIHGHKDLDGLPNLWAKAFFRDGKPVSIEYFQHGSPEERSSQSILKIDFITGGRTSTLSTAEILAILESKYGRHEEDNQGYVITLGNDRFRLPATLPRRTLLQHVLAERLRQAQSVSIQADLSPAGSASVLGLGVSAGPHHAGKRIEAHFQSGKVVNYRLIAPVEQVTGNVNEQVILVEKMLQAARSERPDFTSAIRLLDGGENINLPAREGRIPLTRRVVFDFVKEDPPTTSTRLDRLRLAFSRIEGSEKWDALANEYVAALPGLSSFLANRMILLFLGQLAHEGKCCWPKKMVSVGAGPGEVFQGFQDIQTHLKRNFGYTPPDIVDLDYSIAMLRRSPNPYGRVLALGSQIPLVDGSLDGLEISSPYRFKNGQELLGSLKEASRVLCHGGLLWMKVEALYFAPEFGKSLASLGFQLITPINARLEFPRILQEKLPPEMREKVNQALHQTHFLVAVRDGSKVRPDVKPTFEFLKKPSLGEEVDEMRHFIKQLLRSQSDDSVIAIGRNYCSYLGEASTQALTQHPALALGTMKTFLLKLFPRTEVGPIKPLSSMSTPELARETRRLRVLLAEAQQSIRDDALHPAAVYIDELSRGLQSLEDAFIS